MMFTAEHIASLEHVLFSGLSCLQQQMVKNYKWCKIQMFAPTGMMEL